MRTIRTNHPLMGKITHLDSWVMWYMAWRRNSCVEVRHGLLHVGLDFPINRDRYRYNSRGHHRQRRLDTQEERILFYLRVADGWTSAQNFVLKDEQWCGSERGPATFSNLTPPEQRQRLAAKAFAMLFSGPFVSFDEERARKDYDYQRAGSYWKRLGAREVLALLRFFRVTRLGLNNLPVRYHENPWSDAVGEIRAHLLARVERFLVDFICFLWEKFKPQERNAWFRDSTKPTEEEQEKAAAAKEHTEREQKFADSLARHHYLLARMLVQLGHIDKLNKLPMDERTLRLLRHFALRMRITVNVHDSKGRLKGVNRSVASLGEVLAFRDTFSYREDSARKDVAQFILPYDAEAEAVRKTEEAEAPQRAAAAAELARQEVASREAEADKLEERAKALRTGKAS